MNLYNDWDHMSISERIEWYDNEMDNLFIYLAKKNPFSEEQLGQAAVILQKIKYHMRRDLKTVPIINADDLDIEYFDAVGLAFLELEKIESDFSNWYDVLGRANEIIIFFKHK